MEKSALVTGLHQDILRKEETVAAAEADHVEETPGRQTLQEQQQRFLGTLYLVSLHAACEQIGTRSIIFICFVCVCIMKGKYLTGSWEFNNHC